jgi:hypothetical protein
LSFSDGIDSILVSAIISVTMAATASDIAISTSSQIHDIDSLNT